MRTARRADGFTATTAGAHRFLNETAVLLEQAGFGVRSGKLARLTEMPEGLLDAGDKALVFTQLTEMGDIIRRHLQETFAREVLFLHGGTPRKRRDEVVQRFQSADGPPVFLALAGGRRHRAEPDRRDARAPLRPLAVSREQLPDRGALRGPVQHLGGNARIRPTPSRACMIVACRSAMVTGSLAGSLPRRSDRPTTCACSSPPPASTSGHSFAWWCRPRFLSNPERPNSPVTTSNMG